MNMIGPTTAPHGPRRRIVALVPPLVALSLALTACSQGGPAAEPTQQETTVQSATPQPSPSSGAPEPTPAPSAPATGPTTPPTRPATAPATTAWGTNARLTISFKQDAAAEPVQYVLECVDGTPGPASTLPDAEAACSRLGELGAQFFTARPNKDVICTQQYGGPQTASITGDIDGTSVVAAFALTDGCEISRWDRVKDILGTPGAQ
ncbi:hypothetical protein ASF21_00575 [Arthrobacter sp. Leaf234]|nr:hypothetical protein ASF21_00575 [Arthrobacter sp. Leaf234]